MSAGSKCSGKAVGYMVVLQFLILAALGCNSSAAESAKISSEKGAVANSATIVFTAGDVAALEKGLAREADMVRAARERGNNATTPEERGKAAQDEWEDQTIPAGAQAAGLSVERYREVRETVTHVLETLDFQGKIDGPLEIDVEHAAAEMKQRLAVDPFTQLATASVVALRARMGTIVPVWVHYMQLTALNG
jgi:hypothetical protein